MNLISIPEGAIKSEGDSMEAEVIIHFNTRRCD